MHAILGKLPEARRQIATARPPAVKAKQDRTALFEKRDVNHDDKLTRQEFLGNQPDPAEAAKRFSRCDTNKDGTLSREKFIKMGAAPEP